LKDELIRNMANDNSLYDSVDSIHNGCYRKQIEINYGKLNFRPLLYIIMQQAIILNMYNIPYS